MATISVRVDERLKKDASDLFNDLGLDLSSAINLFLRQSVLRNGIPFSLTRDVPNAETLEALEEVRRMREGTEERKVYSDPKAMFEELDREV